MKTRLSILSANFPQALQSLNKQLSMGSPFKTLVVKVFIELGEFNLLMRIPILKDLLLIAKGLVSGHIAEVELVNSISPRAQIAVVAPKLRQRIQNEIVDVLIIGSGPGSVVATLMEHGKGDQRIHILERGGVPKTPHSLHHSLTHVIQDFNQAGQELIVAPGFPLYAQANVVGGGSEVNSGLYHNLPAQYVSRYASAFQVTSQDWLDAEQKTNDLLDPVEMDVLPAESLLARGGEVHNLVVSNIPRWRTYFGGGSFQHRGMNEIFWNKNSISPNITLSENSEAIKISIDNPDYVEVTCRDSFDKSISIIRAKRLHVAAGSISTPVLLAKSGLIKYRQTRFAWHPMIRIVASTDPTDLGAGDIDPFQAWTVDRTLKFGSAVSTAPLLSIALGRTVSLKESTKLRSYYASFSSSGRGGILPIVGLPWYRFSKLDRKFAVEGTALLKDMISAGGGQICNEGKISSKKFSTVHIFGTLPIDSDIFIPGTNQLRIDKRVRVSDASILPFGPGVNPQGVVMTAVRIANLGISDE
jgi:hypothetical protein